MLRLLWFHNLEYSTDNISSAASHSHHEYSKYKDI